VASPPRIARLLLKLAVEDRFSGEVMASLDQEFEELVATGGERWARRWYRRQVLHSLGPLVRWRLTRRSASWRKAVMSVMRSTPGLDGRYAMRNLFGAPSFTLVVVLTFAFGIGANTAVFSLVHSLILEPLPFPGGDRVVQLWRYEPNTQGARSVVPPARPMVAAWQEASDVFDEIGGYTEEELHLSTAEDVEIVMGARISPGILSMVSARPLVGRLFGLLEGIPGYGNTVILSEETWVGRFGSDPGVVGRTVLVDGAAHTIVGVLPGSVRAQLEAGFFGRRPKEVLLPLPSDPVGGWSGRPYIVARLRPGVTAAAAQSRLDEIQTRVAPLIEGHSVWFPLVRSARDATSPTLRRGLWVVLGAVTLVLLVACANIAMLLLVRRVGREAEMRVRLALGAGRTRLAGEMLAESLLVGCAGVLMAILAARWMLTGAAWIAGTALPEIRSARLNPEALGFAVALGLVTVLAFSLIPILHLGRLTPAGAASREWPRPDGHPVGWRAHRSLVVAQVALATVLVLVAGLLSRSLGKLLAVDPGFQTAGLAAVGLDLSGAGYEGGVERIAFFEEVVRGLEGRPGIEAVGWARFVPPRVAGAIGSVHVEGLLPAEDTQPEPHAGNWVAPSYFTAVGTPFVAGRPFTSAEISDRAQVVILNRTGARRLWPDGRGGVGSRIQLVSDYGPAPWMTVVGIVPDVKAWWLGDDPNRMQVYLPVSDVPPRSGVILVRGVEDLGEVKALVQHEVRRLDSGLPVGESYWVRDAFRQTVARQRFQALLLSSFGVIGLLLAVLGVYGVLSLSVTRRSREIGVRLALGATRGDVSRAVLVQGARAVAVGTSIGLALSYLAHGFLADLLWGIEALDPASYLVSLASIGLAGMAATWVSTRRAMGIDPVDALKRE
jgi:putative ABC transport system permease protein